MSNAGSGVHVRAERQIELDAYDRLPPEWRKLLQDLPLPFMAAQIEQVLAILPPQAVLAGINGRIAAEFAEIRNFLRSKSDG